MSNPKDIQAFPLMWTRRIGNIEEKTVCEGMTLRDYFAAKAMAAIIVGNHADSCVTGQDGAMGTSKDAYVVADAMLAERMK